MKRLKTLIQLCSCLAIVGAGSFARATNDPLDQDTSPVVEVKFTATCDELSDLVQSTQQAVNYYYNKESDVRFMVYSLDSEIKRIHEKFKLKAILTNGNMKRLRARLCTEGK